MSIPVEISEFLVFLSFLFGPTIIVAYFVTTVAMIMNRKPGVKLIYFLLGAPMSYTRECLTERGIMWRNVSVGILCVGAFYIIAFTQTGKWGH